MTTDWIVLLIGGTAAASTTSAARRIATVSGATLLHTDDVWLVLEATIGGDAPRGRREIAGIVSSALERVIAHHLAVADKIVIAGVWVAPELAARSSYAGAIAGDRRRAVFVLDDEGDRDPAVDTTYGRWVRSESKRLDLATVSARPVGHLAERILAVL